MVLIVHGLDLGAHAGPEVRQALHRRVIGAVAGLLRGQDHPAIVEQFGKAGVRSRLLGARDGVAGDDEHGVRRRGVERRCSRRLDRAHIGDGRAGLIAGRRLHGRLADGAHRRGEQHQIGVLDRLGQVGGHVVGQAQLLDAGLGRALFGHGDEAGQALGPHGARHRAADQAAADDGDLVVDRRGHAGSRRMKAARPAITSRLCCSNPTVMRR